ncbi:MAG: carboxypeptidase-like regulatory domain-containing protein [Ferruginibacter sp.]
MKHICLLLVAALFFKTGISQQNYFTVAGQVLNEETRLPMQGASVFAQNTTLGTATDASGNFKLYLPNGGYDIAITFTGFTTETKRVSSADGNNNLEIFLKQKEKEMAEVSIVSTSEVKDGWDKYGTFFIDNFIGKTDNSSQCRILNPEALKFYFSKKRNRLKILSTEPVLIENKALGYNIRYALDSFTYEYNTDISFFTGSPLFEEQAADSLQQKKWELARQEAYKGSLLHFMRSLYNKQLKEEDFEVQFIVKQNDKERALPLRNFYAALNYNMDDSSHTVEIKPNQTEVGILYKKEKPAAGFINSHPGEPVDFQFSVLSFLPHNSIIIEQNGYYYEQNEIAISAYWTWDKVANLLPYDFNEKKTL